MFKPLVNFLFQLREGFIFAMEAIMINKLRTFLSLFGITIGIFSIISVFTVLDALENTIRANMNSLGSNMVYVQRFPWGPEDGDNEYKWWKYLNRPQPKSQEYEQLKELVNTGEQFAYFAPYNRTVKYGSEYYNNTNILGVTYSYGSMRNTEIANGRYFTEFETQNGAKVAVIGSTIAESLFGNTDPVGKRITIDGKKATVIGVVAKEGDNIFGNTMDEAIMLPLKFAYTMIDERNTEPAIMIKAREGVTPDDLGEEVEVIMRQIRRLSPTTENNFSVNRLSLVEDQAAAIFSSINLSGGLISIFAIIVGGFGIANIMFVSVRERMTQIGIQKALGAKSYVILMLFLYESIFLSVIGGILGLIFIYIGTLIINNATDFIVTLTLPNILIGISISAIIGAISGYLPARQAAKMEPVKAIFKT